MIKIHWIISVFILSSALLSCKKKADLIVYNALVYTIDSNFSQAQAFAIADGKFIAVGADNEILKTYDATQKIDLQKQFVYPGLIDAHCHFNGYAKGLIQINLVGTKSMNQIIDSITNYIKKYPERKWIIGRGWDQNDWEDPSLPTNQLLNEKFPHLCIVLKRIDGHALLANESAIEASDHAEFHSQGGKIHFNNGMNTGLYIDNAMELIESKIPDLTDQEIEMTLLEAQKNCFQVGLTSLCEAGLEYPQIAMIKKLQEQQKLKMRVYAMVAYSPDNLNQYIKTGAYKNDHLHIRSFKLYADGALGSRGACLMSPYHDELHHHGFLLKSKEALDSILFILNQHHIQANTHCIGDSANRILLKLYAKNLNGAKNERWRIEHAQVLATEDFELFKTNGIIPSIQPTHATSDMYWAESRLGKQRIKNAYAYQRLLESAGIVASGTDFPVEDINPFYTFCSAVFRMDKNNFPKEGYQMENALSRENTLRSMTIWAAYAQFEEKEKGSIEKGKLADFIILKNDLMKDDFQTIRKTKVVATYLGGKKVF